MALRFVEGFGQFQGHTGVNLLASLTRAGYSVSRGVELVPGRHSGSYALELQVSPGSAGLTWSSRVNGAKSDLRAVAYGNGKWVAVGNDGAIYVSADTITWTPAFNLALVNLLGVAYGNGKWVAVGGENLANAKILTSEDGLAWTERLAPFKNADLKAVAYGDNRWVAVGHGHDGGGVIFISEDGETWGQVDGAVNLPLNDVIYHQNFGWVIVGNQGSVQRSSDGYVWTSADYGAAGNINSIAYDGSVLAAVAGLAFRKSLDGGATWMPASQLSNVQIYSLAAADGLWVAVGNNSSIYTSTDLETWTRRSVSGQVRTFYAVAVSPAPNAAWVTVGQAVGASSANVAASIFVSMAQPTTISRSFRSAATRVVLGFAHKATTRGRIASIEGVCDIDWPSGIEILGQLGNAVPIRNTWYYYEIVIDKTAKVIRLYINDTFDLEVPLPPAAEGVTEFKVTWQVENGAVGQIADIYWLDNDSTDGALLTDRLKPIRITTRFPTEDVQTEWNATDQLPHWQIVGMPAGDMSKYVYSNESGATELFRSSDELPPLAGDQSMPILAVGLVALASKSDLDNRQLGFVIGDGATQREVIETEMTMDPKYSYAVFDRAPGSAGWSAELIEGMPFGVVVRP